MSRHRYVAFCSRARMCRSGTGSRLEWPGRTTSSSCGPRQAKPAPEAGHASPTTGRLTRCASRSFLTAGPRRVLPNDAARRRGGTDARAHRPLAQRGTRRMAAGAVQLWPARRWLGGGGRRALVGGRLARRAVEAARATRRQGRGLRPVTLPLPLSPRTPKAMHSAFLAALA